MFRRNHRSYCAAAAIVGFAVATGVSAYFVNRYLLSENSSLKAKLNSLLGLDSTDDEQTEDWICYCDDTNFANSITPDNIEFDEATDETELADQFNSMETVADTE